MRAFRKKYVQNIVVLTVWTERTEKRAQMSSAKSVKKIHKTLSLGCKLFLVLLVCLRRLTAAEKKRKGKEKQGSK
jgi:hypothetical protein